MSRAREGAWLPLLLLLLVPVAIHAVSGRHHSGSRPGAGPVLFGTRSLDSLLAGSRGLPVVLNLWATWCTPCAGELPDLDSLSREFSDRCLVVAVDVGDPDSTALLAFLSGAPLSFPVVWLDPEASDSLQLRYALPEMVPVTIFIDSSGAEASRAYGARSYEYFASAVSGLAACPTAGGGGGSPAGTAGTLHVTVVGPARDSLTCILVEAAESLAGREAVTILDPGDPAGAAAIDSLRLPPSGWPYAQPCLGGACGRPVHSPAELVDAVGLLQNH